MYIERFLPGRDTPPAAAAAEAASAQCRATHFPASPVFFHENIDNILIKKNYYCTVPEAEAVILKTLTRILCLYVLIITVVSFF